jgi:formylglycine-generating enzyme required for sulfatase activity
VADKARADAVWSETRAEAGRERITELLTHRDDLLLHEADAQINVDPLTQDRHRAFDQGRFVLTGVADVDGCYCRLRRHSQITQALKQRLANRADVLLRAIGKPYVRTRLFRWIEVNNLEAQRKKRKKNWLTPDETVRFYAGEYPPGETAARIRVLAESGFGKSTLLIDLEGEIARGDDSRVPLRLGAGLTEPPRTDAESPQSQSGNELLPLDDRLFAGKETEVLQQIARTIVRPLLSVDRFSDTEIDEWLAEVVKRGEVVWLLDAADQSTTPDLRHLGEFLNSTAARCVAVVTGRPEITQTLPLLWRLQGRSWDELAAGGFGRRQIVEYCSQDLPEDQQDRGREIAGRLLADKLCRPLLVPPILAEQMKQLAQQPDGLRGLKNREAIYARTLPKLLDKGLESLKSRGYAPAIKNNWTHATLEAMFGRLAWTMVQAETKADSHKSRLTGAAQGAELEALKQTLTVELDVLWQLGLTVGAVLFDRDGRRETGLAWRHLSFCEYFAGQHLASLPAKEQRETVIAQARNVRWRWILRFALSSADRQARDPRSTVSRRKQAHTQLENLARGLIAGGNPCLLADAHRWDRFKLPLAILKFVGWLLHRSLSHDFMGANFLPRLHDGTRLRPRMTLQDATDLARFFHPARRDSKALDAAWELIEAGCDDPNRKVRVICQKVSDKFLSEFERLIQHTVRRAKQGKSRTVRDQTVLSLLPDERLVSLGLLSAEALERRRRWSPQLAATLQEQRANYGACPPDGWRHPTDLTREPLEFDMGETNSDKSPDECPRHRVRLRGRFLMGRAPVTNQQFELFVRGHDRNVYWQSASNRLDDHPVVFVTHLQADLFCLWLTGRGQQGRFALPTEVQWEYACRAGQDGSNDLFGVGNCRALTHDDANFGYALVKTNAVYKFAPNAWGLCDMHGNVWEWCQDWYAEEWYQQRMGRGKPPYTADTGPAVGARRVVRGGSWGDDDIYCRSSFRLDTDPLYAPKNVGFRVCWRGE